MIFQLWFFVLSTYKDIKCYTSQWLLDLKFNDKLKKKNSLSIPQELYFIKNKMTVLLLNNTSQRCTSQTCIIKFSAWRLTDRSMYQFCPMQWSVSLNYAWVNTGNLNSAVSVGFNSMRIELLFKITLNNLNCIRWIEKKKKNLTLKKFYNLFLDRAHLNNCQPSYFTICINYLLSSV